MIKKIFNLIKKFVLAVLFIYGYNVIVSPINTTMPINFLTILLVTFFGLPAVIGYCLFSLFVFWWGGKYARYL